MGKSHRASHLTASEGPESQVPSTASHDPQRDPESDGGYVRSDWGGVTVGKANGAVGSPDFAGWFLRMVGGDGKTSITTGGQVARPDLDSQDAKGHRTGRAAGVDIDWNDPWSSALSLSRRAVRPGTHDDAPSGVDGDGELADGREVTGKVSSGGVEIAGRAATGMNKVDGSVKVGPDGVGVKGGYEAASGRGGGGSFSVGDGRVDAGVEIKPADNFSVSLNVHGIDDDEAGRSTNELLPERAWEVAHVDGKGVAGSAGFDTAHAGFGVSGGRSGKDRVAMQRGEDRIRAEFDPTCLPAHVPNMFRSWDDVVGAGLAELYLETRYASRVAGVGSVADVDLEKLGVGDGWTFQHESASSKGANLRLGPGAVGFGDKDLDVSRTSVARDEKGWRIRVQTSERDEDEKSGSFYGFGGAETNAEATSGAVELAIEDTPGGRQALKQFQLAGLLPGADKLADPDDPDRVAYEEALAAYEYLRIVTAGTGDGLPELQKELYEASAGLNARVLGVQGRQLVDAAPSGTAYTGHTVSRTESTSAKLEALGIDLADSGLTRTSWDHAYREGGRTEIERGSERDQNRWIGPDETASVTVNPERAGTRGGKAAELVLRSTQTTDEDDRLLLHGVGAKGMDPAVQSAWALGEVHDAERARIAVALGQDQLDLVRDRMGPKGDDLAGLVEDARYGVDTFGQAVARSETGRLVTQLGDGDGVSAYWTQVIGKDRAGAIVDKVTSVEAFQELPYEEKRLFLVASAQGAQYREEWKQGTGREDAQPWRVLPLALQVKDPEQREQLVRDLFDAVEGSSLNSTCASLQLVQFLKEDGKLAGLSDKEIAFLLGSVSVELEDERVDERAKTLAESDDAASELAAGLLRDTSRDLVLGDRRFDIRRDDAQLLSMGSQRQQDVEANRGDALVDWLVAAERAKGPKLVAEGLKAATLFDRHLVERIVEDTRHEPWRQTQALRILQRAGVDVQKELAKRERGVS